MFLMIFYGPWQSVSTDFARQIVFEERDAVFDLAARSRLDFASAEYREIRHFFNRLIRHAHELNWVRFVIHAEPDKPVPSVDLAVEKISDLETRREVLHHLRRARYAMIAMIGAKSLPLLIVLVLVGGLASFMGTTREVFRRIDNAIGRKMALEAEAI
ncbi:MAG: hypothetical protein FWD68_13905 [Alphaproteobacteria bacterium]|nr:hypothetical protein [Alphaproteobacteria bacterium]